MFEVLRHDVTFTFIVNIIEYRRAIKFLRGRLCVMFFVPVKHVGIFSHNTYILLILF